MSPVVFFVARINLGGWVNISSLKEYSGNCPIILADISSFVVNSGARGIEN